MRRGFTLIEILISVAVLAIVLAVAMPTFSKDDRQRISAAAMLLVSDVEYAQIMTIANPQDPLVVRFDANRVRYWIAPAHSPDDPVDRPDTGEPYIVVLGAGRAETVAGMEFAVLDMSARTLEFESHGGLADFTRSPSIIFSPSGAAYPRAVLTVAPTTGTITVAYEPRAP